MLSNGQREMLRGQGTMLGRMLIGLLFFFSGVGIIVNGPATTTLYFESLNIPLAALATYLVLILKIAAGGMLIVGYRVGVASGALIIFTLLTTLIAHLNINDDNLFKNLAIVGGLLYVMAYGAGEGWQYTGSDPMAKVMTPTDDPPTNTTRNVRY